MSTKNKLDEWERFMLWLFGIPAILIWIAIAIRFLNR